MHSNLFRLSIAWALEMRQVAMPVLWSSMIMKTSKAMLINPIIYNPIMVFSSLFDIVVNQLSGRRWQTDDRYNSGFQFCIKILIVLVMLISDRIIILCIKERYSGPLSPLFCSQTFY